MKLELSPLDSLATNHLRFTGVWMAIGALMVLSIGLVSTASSIGSLNVIVQNDKVAHAAVYTIVMFWHTQIFRHYFTRLALAFAFIAAGITLEFLQMSVPGRQFEIMDIVANSSGVLLGWALGYTRVGSLLANTERWLTSVLVPTDPKPLALATKAKPPHPCQQQHH